MTTEVIWSGIKGGILSIGKVSWQVHIITHTLRTLFFRLLFIFFLLLTHQERSLTWASEGLARDSHPGLRSLTIVLVGLLCTGNLGGSKFVCLFDWVSPSSSDLRERKAFVNSILPDPLWVSRIGVLQVSSFISSGFLLPDLRLVQLLRQYHTTTTTIFSAAWCFEKAPAMLLSSTDNRTSTLISFL